MMWPGHVEEICRITGDRPGKGEHCVVPIKRVVRGHGCCVVGRVRIEGALVACSSKFCNTDCARIFRSCSNGSSTGSCLGREGERAGQCVDDVGARRVHNFEFGSCRLNYLGLTNASTYVIGEKNEWALPAAPPSVTVCPAKEVMSPLTEVSFGVALA
jgi:hypothetical protein